MPGRVDEQVFDQRDEPGEHHVHDIDIRRQSDTAIPHVPLSFGCLLFQASGRATECGLVRWE
jgi:hypothetical protein